MTNENKVIAVVCVIFLAILITVFYDILTENKENNKQNIQLEEENEPIQANTYPGLEHLPPSRVLFLIDRDCTNRNEQEHNIEDMTMNPDSITQEFDNNIIETNKHKIEEGKGFYQMNTDSPVAREGGYYCKCSKCGKWFLCKDIDKLECDK